MNKNKLKDLVFMSFKGNDEVVNQLLLYVDKQIPKSFEEFSIVNSNNEPTVILKSCLRCKSILPNKNNYCGNCGQKIYEDYEQ